MYDKRWGTHCWDMMGDIADQVGANRNAPPPVWYQAGSPAASAQASGPAADPNAPDSDAVNAQKRADMVALVKKWMPTTLLAPKKPDGETRDLLAIAGWDKARGVASKAEKDKGVPVVTSCGDVLTALLKMWKSNVLGAFNMRDQTLIPTDNGKFKLGPGAIELGLYVKADGSNKPRPGDIIVLRDGTGPGSVGTVGHIGIFIEEYEGGYDDVYWRTGDGGAGTLPDQSAEISDREIGRYENKIPVLISPTDKKEKLLDGWIDLDKLKQTGNWTY